MWVHSGFAKRKRKPPRRVGRSRRCSQMRRWHQLVVPVDPTEDADAEEQRARIYLQEDFNQAVEDGFSIATEESITVIDDEIPPDDMGDVEIIPGVEEWDVIESSTYCCGQTAR